MGELRRKGKRNFSYVPPAPMMSFLFSYNENIFYGNFSVTKVLPEKKRKYKFFKVEKLFHSKKQEISISKEA